MEIISCSGFRGNGVSNGKKKWPEQHQQLSGEGFAHQELGSCIFESILRPLYTGAPICETPLTGDLMSWTAASALHPSP